MTGVFSVDMKKQFGAIDGAYTTMTSIELNKMTYNVKADIRDLLIRYLGYCNIPRVGITEEQTISFYLNDDESEKKEIQCKFSKNNKDEMTIYFDSYLTANCSDGDYWCVYFKEDIDTPYLRIIDQDKWHYWFPSAIDDLSEGILDGEEDLEVKITNDEEEFPTYNISVEKGFFTVYELKRKYDQEDKRLILDADFQRDNVWSKDQKAELIESILMGLPLPIFYFNQDKLGKLIVVDGRQRLTALFEFMSNGWRLRGLKVLNKLNGLKFNELDPIAQSKIEDYQIQAHVILPPTPDRIKFDIFDRVNRAGTKLNKQEIRNALYHGQSTDLLNRLSKSDAFERATNGTFIKDVRMKGKYLLLRFIAFEMLFAKEVKKDKTVFEYKNDIDELLGATMETINGFDQIKIDKIETYTIDALDRANKIIGEDAFRLKRHDGSRGPINMNVFEVVMHIMKESRTYNLDISENLKSAIELMKENNTFVDAIGNHRDNIKKIETRYEIADEILRRGTLR